MLRFDDCIINPYDDAYEYLDYLEENGLDEFYLWDVEVIVNYMRDVFDLMVMDEFETEDCDDFEGNIDDVIDRFWEKWEEWKESDLEYIQSFELES